MEDKDERIDKVKKVSEDIKVSVYKLLGKDRNTTDPDIIGYVLFKAFTLSFIGITEGRMLSSSDIFKSVIMLIGFIRDTFLAHNTSIEKTNAAFDEFLQALIMHLRGDDNASSDTTNVELKELEEIEYMISEIKKRLKNEQKIQNLVH